jgi:hypothetical protein
MLRTKDSKIAIIRSLVASTIFLILLKPIFEFLWTILVKVSNHTYTFYVDTIYQNAALGQRNWIDFIILTFIYAIALAIVLTLMYILDQRIRVIRLNEEIRKEGDKEKKERLKDALSKKLSRFEKLVKIARCLMKMRIGIYIISILSFLSLMFTAYTDLQLNTSFTQRLNVIAPYITDNELKILRSKWALMESRSDFDVLNDEMELVAKQKNITLPKNLLK